MVYICMYSCSKQDICIYTLVLLGCSAYIVIDCYPISLLFQLFILLVEEDRGKCYRSGTQ